MNFRAILIKLCVTGSGPKRNSPALREVRFGGGVLRNGINREDSNESAGRYQHQRDVVGPTAPGPHGPGGVERIRGALWPQDLWLVSWVESAGSRRTGCDPNCVAAACREDAGV